MLDIELMKKLTDYYTFVPQIINLIPPYKFVLTSFVSL